MKKLAIMTIIIAVFLVGFSSGTYYGFNEGVRNFFTLERIITGVISKHQASLIKKEKLDNVIFSFELDIDSAIHSYDDYNQNGNKFLSEILLPTHTQKLEEYVDELAEYRKTHPIVFSPEWAKPVEGDDSQTKAWRADSYKKSEEMLLIIQSVLRERGVPEDALTSQGSNTPAAQDKH